MIGKIIIGFPYGPKQRYPDPIGGFTVETEIVHQDVHQSQERGNRKEGKELLAHNPACPSGYHPGTESKKNSMSKEAVPRKEVPLHQADEIVIVRGIGNKNAIRSSVNRVFKQPGAYVLVENQSATTVSKRRGHLGTIQPVIGCLVSDNNIVHVAFLKTGRSDLNEPCFSSQFLNILASHVSHSRLQSPDQLIDRERNGAPIGDPASIPSGTSLLVLFTSSWK